MPAARTGGSGHRILRLGGGDYEIAWSYEVKFTGSRLLFHRTMRRVTDRKGAERFAKRWGVRIPDEPA